jgi:hypothetical protein
MKARLFAKRERRSGMLGGVPRSKALEPDCLSPQTVYCDAVSLRGRGYSKLEAILPQIYVVQP